MFTNLSQKCSWKKMIVSFVMVFVALVAFVFSFGKPSYADTYYQETWFATEDGRWDKTIKTTSTDNDVRVKFGKLWKVNKSTGYTIFYASDYLPLEGRLCNAYTGACTQYKSFNGNDFGAISFTDMKPGTFYLDVRDWESGYTYQGYVSASVK
ncbi:hypothetical protein R4Z09_19755 [Niallia oryzisoli]|uniref:Uncharacterized protein n=1 Tax=Niallia oryzisoli TaxID=1737571 RepID=A0ABZ2C7G9_9BACI